MGEKEKFNLVKAARGSNSRESGLEGHIAWSSRRMTSAGGRGKKRGQSAVPQLDPHKGPQYRRAERDAGKEARDAVFKLLHLGKREQFKPELATKLEGRGGLSERMEGTGPELTFSDA